MQPFFSLEKKFRDSQVEASTLKGSRCQRRRRRDIFQRCGAPERRRAMRMSEETTAAGLRENTLILPPAVLSLTAAALYGL